MIKCLKTRHDSGLLFLGAIFSATIVILVLFGFYVINLKSTMDYIYNKNISQNMKLDSFKELYLKDIDYPILKTDEEQLSSIKQNIDKLQKEWNNYLQTNKEYENQSFINRLKLSLLLPKKEPEFITYEKNLERSIAQIIVTIDKKLDNLEDEKQLQGYLKYLQIQISTLSNHNLENIKNLIKIVNSRYDTNFKLMVVVTIGMLIVSTILLFLTIRSVRILNIKLEESVREKTEELRVLNQNLKDTLKKEIELSRVKDKTILSQARMASMSEMLENVAHQWRQPLSLISMIIQSFETKALKNKLNNEFIKKQVKEGLFLTNSMSKTLSDFQTFFSPNKAKETFSLNSAILSALKITKISLNKKGISVEFNQDSNYAIYSYKNELIQVIINIINNAKDAINENSKHKFIIIKTYEENNMTVIEITDSGGGIEDDIVDKIFDPYFTTKHKSIGTGIGLYMSKNIIEKHIKGELNIKNVILNKFNRNFVCARFTIKIPMRDLISKFE